MELDPWQRLARAVISQAALDAATSHDLCDRLDAILFLRGPWARKLCELGRVRREPLLALVRAQVDALRIVMELGNRGA